ncbi:uncharacterized protein [Phyllobates terribilis]|uniref:uncharacterized protein n=1 Tax=Phyllobates terribilis TaxID=111132 RepID=UPI003CCA9B56
MASACVNSIGVSPESFLDCPPAYGWMSPRISFGRQYSDEDKDIFVAAKPNAPEASDLFKDGGDFEFRLDDSVTMLPADELFSDGKLVPLQLAPVRSSSLTAIPSEEETKSGPESTEVESVAVDPNLFSPKAPRCSRHWRELLGLRKLHQKANATTSSSNSSNTGKSIRHFLQRSSKSDVSVNVPLLKDSDSESFSVSSSRHSLSSSSSSGHDHDDLPRLSLDADIRSSQSRPNPGLVRPRVRTLKPRMVSTENPKPLIDHPSAPTTMVTRGVSLDSPRLSSSGKIVFYGLERSSSSPSTFNGGPRYKHRGMERSYSSNVRVTPVLNVPLCKTGVFGLFSSQKKDGSTNSGLFSSQKKDGSTTVGNGPSRSHNHHHHHSGSGCGRMMRREKE